MIFIDMAPNELMFLALLVVGTFILGMCLWIISDYLNGDDDEVEE